MSPESCAERGTGGHSPTASSSQDGAQKRNLDRWAKFVDEKSNDPRAIALAMAIDQGLAIWPISPARTNMILGYQYRLSVEAEEKAIECLEPWSEDWRTLMDELEARDRALKKNYLLNAKVLALPKPTWGAMESAARELAEYDQDHQFPFDSEPDCHRYLVKMDETHRLLRSLLENTTIRPFLFWMPEGEGGKIDIRRMNATVSAMENIGMAVVCLGTFGLVLFKGVSDTWIKIVLFVAAVGVMAMFMADGTKKHALVLMAVMASVVFGGRDG